MLIVHIVTVPETTCQFGKLRLRIGDFLSAERRRKDTICKCIVPPHAICVTIPDTRGQQTTMQTSVYTLM